MPIKGLTDDQAFSTRKSSYWGGALHKGTRKQKKSVLDKQGKQIYDEWGKEKTYEMYGLDLQHLFRFEPFSDVARKMLLKAYKDASVDGNGDVILPQIDIFLAYEEPGKSFETGMKFWSGSGLERVCDRETILQESGIREDCFGQKHRQMVDCDKPCPMAGQPIGADCVNGCVYEGRLTFYIYLPDLLFEGQYISHPCYLTVHGKSDVVGIHSLLKNIYAKYGSIKQSPIPVGTIHNVIPMILRRTKIKNKRPIMDTEEKIVINGKSKAKRTEKKMDSETWAVSLEVNPLWVSAYELARQAQSVLQWGYKPSPALIQRMQVTPIDVVAIPSAVEARVLLPASSEFASKEEAIALWQYAVQHGWTKEAIKLCLQSAFQIDSFERIPVDKIDDIKSAIAQPGKANEWLEEVARNVMAGK